MIHQLDPKLLACVLPEGAREPYIFNDTLPPGAYLYYVIRDREITTGRVYLPPGTWQIVGRASEVNKRFDALERIYVSSLLTAHGITEEMYPRTVIVKMI